MRVPVLLPGPMRSGLQRLAGALRALDSRCARIVLAPLRRAHGQNTIEYALLAGLLCAGLLLGTAVFREMVYGAVTGAGRCFDFDDGTDCDPPSGGGSPGGGSPPVSGTPGCSPGTPPAGRPC